jgi:hypothetical protein
LTSIEKPDVEVEEKKETPPSTTSTNQNIKSNLEFPHFFPSPNTFQIDLDPFSSNTSKQNPFDDNFFDTPSLTIKQNAKVTSPFIDPFDSTDEFSSVFTNNTKVNEDPFSVFNTVVNDSSNLIKMSSEEDDNIELKFEELNLTKAEQSNQEVNEKSADTINDVEAVAANSALPKKNKYAYDDSSSSSSDDDGEFQMKSVPPPVKQNSVDIVEIRDSFSETAFNVDKQKDEKINKSDKEDDEEKDEDDMDNAFTSFSNEKVASTVDDLPSLTKEFDDGNDNNGIKFENFDAAESSTDFNDQMSLAMRKGDTSLETVNVGKLKMSFKNEDDDNDDKDDDDEEKETNSKSNLRVDKNKKNDDEAVLSSPSPSSNRLEPVDNTKNFKRGVKK